MAPARAALRLRPSPLSAQSPPTYRRHDVIANPSVLPKNHRFSTLLLIPDLAAIIFIFTVKPVRPPRPEHEIGAKKLKLGRRVHASPRPGECLRRRARTDTTGPGPLSPLSSVEFIANNGRTRPPAAAAIPEPGRARMRGGMRLGWGRVKKWKG